MIDEEYDEIDDGDFIDDADDEFSFDIEVHPTTDELLNDLDREDDDYADHSDRLPSDSGETPDIDSGEETPEDGDDAAASGEDDESSEE